MKKYFRKFIPKSIRTKQMLAILATTLSALGLAFVVILVYEVVAFRRELVSNVTTVAAVVGENCTSALDFNDPKSAATALASVRNEPHIRRVVLYDRQGAIFAEYNREGESAQDLLKTGLKRGGHLFTANALLHSHLIRWNGEIMGELILESDLSDFHKRLRHYVIVLMILIVVATGFARLLATLLSGVVLGPALRLVEAARSIRSSQNYSIRAARQSNDELGALVDDFNEMLGQIEKRDLELRQIQQSLEKRVEERTRDLERSVSLVTATLESTADAILVANFSGEITLCNEHFLDLWKIPKSHLEKLKFAELIEQIANGCEAPELLRERVCELNAAQDADFEGEIVLADGRVLQMASNPQRLAHQAVGRVWSFRDITQRKRAEEAISKARHAAEQANRAKSEFLANMSHEIRTPMNGVIGMTQLALDTELNYEQREYLHTVKASAESLMTIINDILDFSKIEAGKLQIDNAPFNLHEVIADVVKTIRLSAHQKHLELLCDLPAEIPAGLVGDATRLRQVLLNLLNNAIKFTSRGEVGLLVVPVAVTETSAALEFQVSDTGIGIPADKLEHVFQAFEQADGSTTRRFGGTGLGLTISRQLVRMMGGDLTVRSTVGQGTTFTFTVTFPRSNAIVTSATAPKAALRGMRVLVVDDNCTNRVILSKLLQKWEMRPSVAASGPEALAMVQEATAGDGFSLLVVDCHMPEMDGFELVQRLKESPQESRPVVMMLTSDDQNVTGARCREVGVHAHLVKPVSAADLLDHILTLLGRSGNSAPIPGPADGSKDDSGALRILVAEDNPVNQKLILRLLQKMGHAVQLAENGRIAVEAYSTGTFDLVLMDVQMPVLDGLEATRQIRQIQSSRGEVVPIYAVTAHAMKRDEERCLAAGMDMVVTKPIEMPKLKAALEGVRRQDKTTLVPPVVAEPEAAADPLPVPHPAVLDQLGEDAEFVRELAATFLDCAPKDIHQLRISIDQGDFTSVRRIAHSLKGAASNFDATEVVQAALELELAARDYRIAGIQPGFARLEAQLTRFQKQLEELVAA